MSTTPQTRSEGEPVVPTTPPVPEEVTPSEPTGQKPNDPVTPNADDTTPQSEDDQKKALAAQAKKLADSDKPLTRKEKTEQKVLKQYEGVVDNDGNVDYDALKDKYETNPKGLEIFAKENNLDFNNLVEELEGGDPLEKRIEEIEARYEEKLEAKIAEIDKRLQLGNQESEEDLYVSKVYSMLETAELTQDEFLKEFGEPFEAEVTRLQQSGLSLSDAGELASAKIIQSAPKEKLDEIRRRTNLTNKVKPLPTSDIPTVINSDEIEMASREDVQSMDQSQRIAYKKKYMNSDGSINYKT